MKVWDELKHVAHAALCHTHRSRKKVVKYSRWKEEPRGGHGETRLLQDRVSAETRDPFTILFASWKNVDLRGRFGGKPHGPHQTPRLHNICLVRFSRT